MHFDKAIAFISLFAIAGCGLLGSSESCNSSLPAPRAGEYVIEVDDGESCTRYPEKEAQVNLGAYDRGTRPVVYFAFGSFGDDGLELFMARQRSDSLSGPEALSAGAYSVADLKDADPVYPGRFQTYRDKFSMAGWSAGKKIYFSRSGNVTVTSVEEDGVAGQFDIVLQIEGRSEKVEVRGRFSARTSDVGWVGFW